MKLFDSNNISQIETFASLIKIETFISNDVVIKQGDIGDCFYIVIEGSAEVTLETKDYLFFDLME